MQWVLRLGVATATAIVSSSAALAQTYPTKPIQMVVPFTAGGPTDTVGRSLAQAMSKQLGQQIVIENVGGAGGTVGAARVKNAAADGYSILLHHIGMSTAPSLYRKLAFNPLTDYETVGLVVDVPMTLIARSDFPADSFRDFLAYAKANKAKMNLANAGIGAASHLCGLLFMSAIEADLTTVPYKGTGPAMNDLLGGQVDMLCDQTTNTVSQIKGGKIKVYCATTPQRVPALPDVPTCSEAGLPELTVAIWHGLYAPKGTPQAVIDKLAAALQSAVQDPMIAQRFAELGTEPVASERATPQALGAHLKAEIEKWAPLIEQAGVYAD
jgi:tripartite-type tricarboxylate transporter receptor subunit TctC